MILFNMKENLKISLRAVALLVCLFISILSSAGAISTLEGIYVIGGILNIGITSYAIYRFIKNE